MPGLISAPTSLNNLTVEGLYVFTVPPTPVGGAGVSTNVAAVVGSAAWGPLNQPQPFSDTSTLYAAFGPLALEPYSLVTEGYFMQTFNNNNLGVRVSDTTDSAASAAILDSGGTITGITITAKYTGTEGNNIGITMVTGSNSTGGAPTVTVTVQRKGYNAEIYPNLAAPAGNGNFWVTLANAINNGISGYRPKSQLVVAAAGTSVLGPAAMPVTVNLAGGTNGALGSQVTIGGGTGTGQSVTIVVAGNSVLYNYVAGDTTVALAATHIAAGLNANTIFKASYVASASGAVVTIAPIVTNLSTYTISASVGGTATATISMQPGANFSTAGSTAQIGVDGTTGRTGMYALRGNIASGQFCLAGNSDATVWATQATFAASEGAMAYTTNASGTSTNAAVAAKSTNNLFNINAVNMKDWLYFQDTTNNQQRLVSPMGLALGLVASMPPWVHPGNKPPNYISAISSTERTGSPYSYGEAAAAQAGGVLYFTNPIPRGFGYGLPHGMNSASSLLPGQDTIEYTRMTNYIAASLANALGGFVGELQSTASNDPTRLHASAAINGFLQLLLTQGAINGYSVQLNTVNNTPATIGQGFMIANVQVSYLAAVRYFVINVQGGSTVQVAVGAPPAQ